MTITQLHTHTLFGWCYYYYYYVAISNTRWLHNNYQDESHYSQMVHHHFTAEEPKKTCGKRENIWKQRGTRRDVQKPTKWKSRNEIPTNTLRFTQTHISASTTCHSAGHCRCRFEWNANWVSARRMSDEFVCTVCVGRTHRQSVYKQMKTVAKKNNSIEVQTQQTNVHPWHHLITHKRIHIYICIVSICMYMKCDFALCIVCLLWWKLLIQLSASIQSLRSVAYLHHWVTVMALTQCGIHSFAGKRK